MTYYYHNPTCILLYTIPEATDLDEKRLHYKFRDYLFDSPNFNCVEWYYYNDEIVDYFKTHTTKESLLDLEEAPENKRLACIRFKDEVYKAVDLLSYFEVMKTRVKDSTTGKFIDGYKILSIKNKD